MKKIIRDEERIKEYFNILEPNFPEWLNEYISTPALQKQKHISVSCGTIYSNLFSNNFFFSSLDHSIAVALIIWHFTHDKKQTLSGLFHDISTPAFKHCIDFLNNDAEKQESTEELTYEVLLNSKEIMTLLARDGIELKDVADYHIYPIADNDSPKLSADRLEYTLSNAYFNQFITNLVDKDGIEEIYNNITIQENENKEIELGFMTKAVARKFVKMASKLSICYREDKTRFSNQFIADIVKKLVEEGVLKIADLYAKKESEIVDIIRSSKYSEQFRIWENAKEVKLSKTEPKEVYFVHTRAKVRFIDPLFNGERISSACKIAKNMIEKNKNFDMSNYVYLDFKL